MDHESLRTAATYLNNLLLARGLLRNGEPIDFVKPSKDSRAQIINLVHDLILRQDRDHEQREHVAVTLRQLRAEEARRNADVERLSSKCEDSARQCASAQSAERAATAEVKKIERTMKTLQEQTAKLKTQLAQVKTQCANDLRKRDLEISKLKTHLQGQQRGNKGGPVAPSMTIVGSSANGNANRRAASHGVADPEYSLKQETTEFLTELSQSLSDENDGLISLIRSSLSTMRELLGLPHIHKQPDSAIGSMGSNDEGKTNSGDMLQAIPTSYETFNSELESTLAHLKTVLTNPNFVTMEEVEVRDEEIARLRDGWERMEQRWKDVLIMMQGWLKRMDTGDSIKIDDLRRGLGLVSPVQALQSRRARQDGSDRDVDSSMLSTNTDDISSMQLPAAEEDSSPFETENQLLQRKESPKRKRALIDPPDFFDLRPKSAVATSPELRPARKRLELDGTDDRSDGDAVEESPVEGNRRMTIAEKLAFAQTEADEAVAANSPNDRLTNASTKSTRGHSARNGSSSRGETRVPDMDGTTSPTPLERNISRADEKDEGEDTLGAMVPNFSPIAKRTNIRGRPRKKRKSTLSPEELEELIGAVHDDGEM